VLAAPPSTAGGWWSSIQIERQYVGVGETVVARSEAFFDTIAQAERAQTKRYYAYLVRGYDDASLRRAMAQGKPRGWWALSPDAELVRVGRVRLAGFNANLGKAHARIEIPEIATGGWALMFCDAGCRGPLANAIPTSVRVTADALAAKTAARVAALKERTQGVADLRADLRDARRDARLRADGAAARAEDMRRDLNSLTRRIQALEAAAQEPPPSSAWPWGVAGALALLTVGIVVATRRRAGPSNRTAAWPDDAMPVDAAWEPPRTPVETIHSSRR
jgi:hypothetical protein